MFPGLKALIPESLKNKVRSTLFGAEGTGIHYSQGGEDLFLMAVLNSFLKIQNGFYIDVGAYHPTIGSNTHLLYKNGWKGMNIDPAPGFKELFDNLRPGDINLNVGISKTPGTSRYYISKHNPKINSFSKESLVSNGVYGDITDEIDMPLMSLSGLIEKHVPPSVEIDVLNIDAEGYEMEILDSINWNSRIPKMILLEQNKVVTLSDAVHSAPCKYLSDRGYEAIAKNIIILDVATILYIRKEFLKS